MKDTTLKKKKKKFLREVIFTHSKKKRDTKEKGEENGKTEELLFECAWTPNTKQHFKKLYISLLNVYKKCKRSKREV
jgi:hypothetical protein